MKIRNLISISTVVILLTGLSACKKKNDDSLTAAGSDTLVQLVQKVAASYMKDNAGKSVSVRGGGSGTGIAALLNGSTHIADASRKMKQKEWDKAKSLGIEVKEHVIALDGVAVLVNPANKISKLTIEQLSGIYAGTTKNWKEVGGANEEILVISRESNSGTHVYFKEKVLRQGDKKSKLEYGKSITYAVSSQQSIDQVKTNKNAICYVGMGWVVATVKALEVSKDGKNFFKPTPANVISGKYPIARTLQMYTNEKYMARIKPFLDYTLGPKGQALVKELGFVPVQ